MRDARKPVPGPAGQPPPVPPPSPPPGIVAAERGRRFHPRHLGVVGGSILLAALGLPTGHAPAAAANGPPTGVLLRQARYALAEGDDDRARGALRSACAAEPGTARGLEAALLLASLEFGRGDRAAAENALTLPAVAARTLPSAGDALLVARGWIALGSDDPAAARLAFEAARSSREPAARDLAAIGEAWASLAGGEPASAVVTLGAVARSTADPVFRTAARWSLARAHAAAGDARRARHALRALRRFARATSFADDVELDLALSELSSGDTRSARRTLLRLARLPGRASGPPRAPGDGPTLDELRLAPRAFVARLAALYAGRPAPAESPFDFLRRALDRDARSDADAVLRLVQRAEGGLP